VAGQAPPAVGGRDRDGDAVGVRVVRDRELRIDGGGERERQVHRAGFLGVRERDGRERGIRGDLRGHGGGKRVSGAFDDGARRLPSDTVHRRVDPAHALGGGGGRSDGGGRRDIGLDDGLVGNRVVVRPRQIGDGS